MSAVHHRYIFLRSPTLNPTAFVGKLAYARHSLAVKLEGTHTKARKEFIDHLSNYASYVSLSC